MDYFDWTEQEARNQENEERREWRDRHRTASQKRRLSHEVDRTNTEDDARQGGAEN